MGSHVGTRLLPGSSVLTWRRPAPGALLLPGTHLNPGHVDPGLEFHRTCTQASGEKPNTSPPGQAGTASEADFQLLVFRAHSQRHPRHTDRPVEAAGTSGQASKDEPEAGLRVGQQAGGSHGNGLSCCCGRGRRPGQRRRAPGTVSGDGFLNGARGRPGGRGPARPGQDTPGPRVLCAAERPGVGPLHLTKTHGPPPLTPCLGWGLTMSSVLEEVRSQDTHGLFGAAAGVPGY